MADTVAVMDAAGVDRAVLAGICASSAWTALMTAAWHPDRCLGVVTIGTWAPFLTPPTAGRAAYDFDQVLDTEEGWAKVNRHYMLRDWPGHLEFFFGEMFPEPHSSKQREDCIGWAMETTAATNLLFVDAPFSSASQEETEAALARVRCPVLTIHGRLDHCQPWRARRAGGRSLPGVSCCSWRGPGTCPTRREPVVVNRAIRDFARPLPARPPGSLGPGRGRAPGPGR